MCMVHTENLYGHVMSTMGTNSVLSMYLPATHLLLQAHFIVDEMLMNGCIVETNKQNVLAPVQLLDKAL